MNILDSASATEKELVRRIVENYRGGYKNIKEDKHSILDSPGCWLHSLFYDFYLSDSSCCINFSNEDNQLMATFVLPKCDDSDEFFQRINIKKASFFEQIAFLKLLFQNNLIFFEKDYDCGLNKFSGHSDQELARWEEHGLRHYDDIIKNNDVFAFINKYYWSRVIPSSILCDYNENNFKTVEARRYEGNARLGRASLCLAIMIALGSPWLMNKCSKTTLTEIQYNGIINSINELRSDFDGTLKLHDSINVSKSDILPPKLDTKRIEKKK